MRDDLENGALRVPPDGPPGATHKQHAPMLPMDLHYPLREHDQTIFDHFSLPSGSFVKGAGNDTDRAHLIAVTPQRELLTIDMSGIDQAQSRLRRCRCL